MKLFVIIAMVALSIYTLVNVFMDLDNARVAFAMNEHRSGMKFVGNVLVAIIALIAAILLVCFMW
jgi:hypothetical protein